VKSPSAWIPKLAALLASIETACLALDVSDVLPQLRTAPPPSSVTERLRLNYYVSVATIAEKDVLTWVDNAGTTNTAEVPTPSGHGVTQVDIVAVTPPWAALHVQPWLFYNFTGPIVPMFGSDASLVCHAGGGDWWVHPEVLAEVTPVLREDLKIRRMPLVIGERIYDALRIQSQDPASRQVLSYDLVTGYLLYKGSAVAGNEAITLSQAYFLGTRSLDLPWGEGRLPGWVTATRRLRYEGTYTAVAWGSDPLVLTLQSDVEIAAVDDNWFIYEQTTTRSSLPGMPPEVDHRTMAGGVNQLLGLCLPPLSVPQLQPGQRLDTDDVTGATLDVHFVGVLPNGRPGVTLRLQAGDSAWAETAYDRATGAAVSLTTYDGASPLYWIRTEVHLVDVPPDLPVAPRLSIAANPVAGEVTISCPTEPSRVLTLLQSTDDCRHWIPVPGLVEVPCTGAPFERRFSPGSTPAFYRVQLR